MYFVVRHALFNEDIYNNNDGSLLESALKGKLFSIYNLLENFTDYIKGINYYDELYSLNDEQLKIVGLNYKLLIGVLYSMKLIKK